LFLRFVLISVLGESQQIYNKEVMVMEKKMNRRELFKTSAAAGAVVIAGDLLKGGSPVAYGVVNMAPDNVFNAAKAGLTWFHAYTNTVAQEIGRERAVSLMTKMSENMGALQGKMMKEKAGINEFDAKTAWSPVKNFKDTIGQNYELIEESPQRVVVRNGRCPIYEAARMLGMDANTIETVCRGGPIRLMDAAVKQLNPNLNARLQKFRSTPDDFCEEVIILT
jgi:L-2-amino-thiazoline-4-carboxylic acid hydrolase